MPLGSFGPAALIGLRFGKLARVVRFPVSLWCLVLLGLVLWFRLIHCLLLGFRGLRATVRSSDAALTSLP